MKLWMNQPDHFCTRMGITLFSSFVQLSNKCFAPQVTMGTAVSCFVGCYLRSSTTLPTGNKSDNVTGAETTM